jgi:hypothetical protein
MFIAETTIPEDLQNWLDNFRNFIPNLAKVQLVFETIFGKGSHILRFTCQQLWLEETELRIDFIDLVHNSSKNIRLFTTIWVFKPGIGCFVQ